MLDLIEMNLVNLVFIRDFYPNSVLLFIKHNIDDYISVVSKNGFNFNEMEKIVDLHDVGDQQKIELLKLTKKPIEAYNKGFSDELLIHILNNNLHNDDIPWIISKYNCFSEEVKETILKIASERLECIVSNYSANIDTSLTDLLFKSKNVDFSAKIRLLCKKARDMDKDKLCSVLDAIGADKIKDNICGGKKKVNVTTENEQVLQALFKAGVILDYSKTVNGQHYKTIKYLAKAD